MTDELPRVRHRAYTFWVSLVVVTLLTTAASAQTVLWTEDFEAEANGDPSGNAAGTPGGTWSVTTSPSGGVGSFSKQDIPIAGNGFQVNDTGTEGVWATNIVDISTSGYAVIDITLLTGGFDLDANDYVRGYYILDGGPEVLFAEMTGAIIDASLAGSAIVAGNTLQLIVRGIDNSTFCCGLGGRLGFDNVSITSVTVLYSRDDGGNWNDNAANGTWSTVGHAGAGCSCIPNTNTLAIIGDGDGVNMNVDGTAAGIQIIDGTLTYTNANIDLNISRGIFRIEPAGSIDRNGQTNARINFTRGVITEFQLDGQVSIDVMNVDGDDAVIPMNGSGTLTINDDLMLSASDMVVTNNLVNSIAVGDDLIFGGIANIFINNGTVAIVGDVVVTGGDDNTLNNLAGSVIDYTAVDPDNNDFVINNAGVINQAGDFINIVNACAFTNEATGLWRWSFTPLTTFDGSLDNAFDLSTVGNTFEYNGNGAQTILAEQYHNLTLSVAGAKSAGNDVSVSGNWNRTGTATFANGGFTITLNGTSQQTISATSGETFFDLTIVNSLPSSPQITFNNAVNVTGTLTMSDGNINLNSNTLTLGTSAVSNGTLSHGGNAANGWIYGGSFSRYVSTTAIALGNARGFFPLGGAADFRPFFLRTTGVTSGGLVTLSHTDANSTTDVSINDAGFIISRRHDAFWTVATSGVAGGGSNYEIRAGGTGFGSITSTNDLRLSLASSVVGTNGLAAGNTTDPRVRRDALNLAAINNDFHIGAINSVLPIILAYYKAEIQDDNVVSTWKTTQEKSNDFFTVQKTIDFETFYDVGTLDGKGDTKETNTYSFVDDTPFIGRSYYRLKQTDFDGRFSYSEPVMIDFEVPAFPVLSVFPNPSNGSEVTIQITGLKDATTAPVVIYDQRGLKLFEVILSESTPGTILGKIKLNEKLPQGIYIVKAGRTQTLVRKIVVN